MRLTNLTTNEIVTVDEYIGTGLLQFYFHVKPGESIFVDGNLGKQSKQLSRYQDSGKLSVISTEMTKELTTALSTIAVESDAGYTATVPLRVVVVEAADPVVARVVSRSAIGFDVKLTDNAGADYSAAPVQIFYEFGTHLNKKTY